MRINEVCSITGLTKKAIGYYEKQALINTIKNNNGYREYDEKHIKLLNEIGLYRKLDISIREIKLILNCDHKHKKDMMKKIIKGKEKKSVQLEIQKNYLEKIIECDFKEERLKVFNYEIVNSEKNKGEFIKNELKRAFPDGLGTFLAYHFAPYLKEPMDTMEKYEAWNNIIEFLDNMPEIKISKAIQVYYENISEEMAEQIFRSTRTEINNMIKAEGEELEQYKKKILDYVEKQNDNSIFKAMNPFYKFKKQINEFFNSSGYYDVFIPNMKILSEEYNKYHCNLIELNEKLCKELGIKYDENMRIIKVNS